MIKKELYVNWEPNAYCRNWMMSLSLSLSPSLTHSLTLSIRDGYVLFLLFLFSSPFADMALSKWNIYSHRHAHMHTHIVGTDSIGIESILLICVFFCNCESRRRRKFTSKIEQNSLFVSFGFSSSACNEVLHIEVIPKMRRSLCRCRRRRRSSSSSSGKSKRETNEKWNIALHFQSTNDAHEIPIGEKSMSYCISRMRPNKKIKN